MSTLTNDVDFMDLNDQTEVNRITRWVADERVNTSNIATSDTSPARKIVTPPPIKGAEYDRTNDEQDYREIQRMYNVLAQKDIFLIVDTNFIISHLNLLNELRQISGKYSSVYKIIIPTQVIKELDGLKMSDKTEDLSRLARQAIDWCYGLLHDNDLIVRGQKSQEKLDSELTKDDAILDCCLFFKDKYPANLVILMSNDKNFCIKALADSIPTISFRQNMTASLIANRIVVENAVNIDERKIGQMHGGNLIDDHEDHPMQTGDHNTQVNVQQYSPISAEQPSLPETMEDEMVIDDICKPQPSASLEESCHTIYNQVQVLTLGGIDHVLQFEFGEDCRLLGYIPSRTNTLGDCITTLRKFAGSAFSEYFKNVKFSESGLNPLTVIKRDHENHLARYYQVPSDIDELVDFYKFWSVILIGLYQKMESRQLEALVTIMESWKGIIEKHTP